MKSDWKLVVIAAAFLAIGFLIADRMAPAGAQQTGSDVRAGTSYAGSVGTTVVEADRTTYVILVRDNKVYRVPIGNSGGLVRPWITLSD